MKANYIAEFRGHVAQITQASASYLSPQAPEEARARHWWQLCKCKLMMATAGKALSLIGADEFMSIGEDLI